MQAIRAWISTLHNQITESKTMPEHLRSTLKHASELINEVK